MRIQSIQNYNTNYINRNNKKINTTSNVSNNQIRFKGEYEEAFDTVLKVMDKGLYTKKNDRMFYFRYLLECAKKEGTVVNERLYSLLTSSEDTVQVIKKLREYTKNRDFYTEPVITKNSKNILWVDNGADIWFLSPTRDSAKDMMFGLDKKGRFVYEDDWNKIKYHKNTNEIAVRIIFSHDFSFVIKRFYDENGEERPIRGFFGSLGF